MTHRRRGFSLVELLLAVFILGLGVIAVAALFPAGIAQQRQSADDIMGPLVADSAHALLRQRVRAEDFGTFEEFTNGVPLFPNPGDWAWARPKQVFPDSTYPFGAMDVFGATNSPGAVEPTGLPAPGSGIPYNTSLYGGTRPLAVISQFERYYPMRSVNAGSTDPNVAYYPGQPQYVWDCMFRRFQGQVQVAIFVYRVGLPAGGNAIWIVPPGLNNANAPSLPVSLQLADAWDADISVIPGTDGGTTFNPADLAQAWQAPGQWLLDQNNNVHRVLSGRRRDSDGPVELMRRVPWLPNVAAYIIPDGGVLNVVRNIWYIPTEVQLDTDGDGSGDLPVTLAPVYVTVRDL